MKILHTGTFCTTAGGPALSSYLTLKGLRESGIDASMFMHELKPNEELVGNDVPVHYTAAPAETKLGYSTTYRKDLEQCGEYDIYHTQGIWQYPTYAVIDHAKKHHKPYLITPRGMLYPQDIRKSNEWLKRFSLFIRLKRDFNQAACVHVTCMEEMKHCRDLGITSPIAVIPNPIEIQCFKEQKTDDRFRVGYLGRLHTRKNVQSLIYAFAELGSKAEKAELLIIGGGDDAYEEFLRKEVKRLQLTNVRFTGFLDGQEKRNAIASLSILAMPSEFENLGNVVLEGLVRGIPCIATKGAPWEELQTHRCGWWVEYNQKAITEAIEQALCTPQEELRAMGENGNKLMREQYSVEAIANKMKALYEWVLSKEKDEKFIYLK